MSDSFWEAAQEFMRFKVEQWQIELAWVQSLQERILSRLRLQSRCGLGAGGGPGLGSKHVWRE
jgi:hypothetical protein